MKQILILLFLCLNVSYGQSLTFPANTTIGWKPGLSYTNNPIPNRPTGTGTTLNAHTTYGADNTGATDATAAIQAALNAATSGSVVYIPTGTYLVTHSLNLKSNVSLRGDGPDATIIHYTGTSTNGCLNADYFIGWSPSQAITIAANKGDKTITVNSSAGMAVNGIINISHTNPSWVDIIGAAGAFTVAGAPQTGGGAAGTGDQNDTTRCLMQLDRITAINGNVLTLSRGLYRDTGINPYINYQAATFSTGVGVENLQINSTGSGANAPTITFSNCVQSWIKNIKCVLASGTKNYCHVFMYNSYANEVRDSWFQGGGVNTSGLDYGVYFFTNTSECLCENNVFVGMRHSMITAGSSGCVFGYNYSTGNWESDSGNTWCAEDACTHGAESYYNLWEGNICGKITFDNTHGGNAWNTAYRNWSLAWSSALSTTSAVSSRFGLNFDVNCHNDNAAGNVWGQSGDVTTGGPGLHNRGQTSDYGLNGDPSNPATGSNNATYYTQGNYSFMLGTIDWVGGIVVTLPASLYQSAKPSWWGTAAYPAIGPDVSPVNGTIPAQDRYNQSFGGPSPAVTLPQGYVLAFNEEFKQGSALDTTWITNSSNVAVYPGSPRWYDEKPDGTYFFDSSGNNGIDQFPNVFTADAKAAGFPAGPLAAGPLNDGYLVIPMFHSDYRTSSQSVGDFSGLICSVDPAGHGFAAKFGYFESKIWIPPITTGSPANAQGLWPAFWLLDRGSIFPGAFSEIDIMEAYSVDYTKYHVNIHNYNGATAPTNSTYPNRFTTVQAASNLSTGWHIFSCLVAPDLIHAYLDGVEVFTCLTGSGDVNPMYILANFAEGGGWPDQQNWGTDPGNNGPYSNTTNMKIQYIRCWALPGNF